MNRYRTRKTKTKSNWNAVLRLIDNGWYIINETDTEVHLRKKL